MTATRLLLYSHDAVGLGHTRRSLTIANALVRQNGSASVLVASGCESLDLFAVDPRVDILRLPGIRKNEQGEYVARHLDVDQGVIRALRSSLLAAAVEQFRPHVLLADKHPAGAGGELQTSIVRHKSRGGRMALGLRDILDEPRAVKAEWERTGAQRAMAHYDEIFVYGDPRVVDHRVAYGLHPGVGPMLRYCGYVIDDAPYCTSGGLDRVTCGPRVLATAGGGEDGTQLLESFIGAAAGMRWDAHVVVGPLANAAARARLEAAARRAGVTMHERVSNLGAQFGSFDALVTMGGYNSLVEAVASGTPTICLPRVFPRSEQAIRAAAFSRLGLIDAIEPAALSPVELRLRIVRALKIGRRTSAEEGFGGLDCGGAGNAAIALMGLATGQLLAATGTGGRL